MNRRMQTMAERRHGRSVTVKKRSPLMKRHLTKAGLVLATATAVIGLTSQAALADPWYRVGVYPAGQSCEYAGYYGWLAGQWSDYRCSVRQPNYVELWVTQ